MNIFPFPMKELDLCNFRVSADYPERGNLTKKIQCVCPSSAQGYKRVWKAKWRKTSVTFFTCGMQFL